MNRCKRTHTHTNTQFVHSLITHTHTHTHTHKLSLSSHAHIITHRMSEVFVFIICLEVYHQKLLEGCAHFVAIPQSKVAQDQVESCLEAWWLRHDVLKGGDGIIVLTHLYKHDANVLHDLCPETQHAGMTVLLHLQKHNANIQYFVSPAAQDHSINVLLRLHKHDQCQCSALSLSCKKSST